MNNILEAYKKLDSSSISDALDSIGIRERILGVFPRSDTKKMVGFAFTVKYELFESCNTKFHNAGNYIDEVSENEIIILDNAGRDFCTTWGGILTKTAEIKKIGGALIYGAIRDIDEVKLSKLPVFSKHIFMCSAKNRARMVETQQDLNINGVNIAPGDLIFGDENGVLIIPKEYLEECLTRAQNIKKNESKILQKIESGMSLSDARKLHRYDQPWLNSEDDQNV